MREIRVVDADGNQMGVMTPREALDIARERGLDLIEVAANAVPPVCRIMDYGKFKYQEQKKAAEAKCGAKKADEAKCGAAKKAHEGKCGEAKCGGKKAAEGKCGEGKCGAKH